MKIKHILLILTSILILLLSSCSTHLLIERKDLEKEIVKDNKENIFKYSGKAEVKFKDNSLLYVDNFVIKSKTDSIRIDKKRFMGRARKKRELHHYKYDIKENLPINYDDINSISFKNRSRGFLEGLLGGTVVGVVGAIVTLPEADGMPIVSMAILLGSPIIGTLQGIIRGHNTHYTFFSDSNNKYKELRRNSSNFFKLGIGVQGQEELPVGFSFGLGRTFDNGNIIIDLSCFNTIFGKNESEFGSITDFEFINIGFKYYLSINKKNSFYIGNSVSYCVTYFDNLDQFDIDNDFEYGEYLGFRSNLSLGYDFFRNNNNNKRNFIDFSVDFPLQEGLATRIDHFPTGATAIEGKVTGGSYWFPTATLTLGFVY